MRRRWSMSGNIVNICAWAASAVFAFLLIKDFIKTEKEQEREKHE